MTSRMEGVATMPSRRIATICGDIEIEFVETLAAPCWREPRSLSEFYCAKDHQEARVVIFLRIEMRAFMLSNFSMLATGKMPLISLGFQCTP